jgi:hypothetical protein
MLCLLNNLLKLLNIFKRQNLSLKREKEPVF